MNGRTALGMLALAACGFHALAYAQPQQADSSKPTVPLVSAIGCGLRTPDGMWMLTNATDGVETRVLFTSAKELEEARKK